MLRCGHWFLLELFTTPGGALNIVFRSNEPHVGHGILFSDFSFIDAWVLKSILHFMQCKS